jgi:hypothetical protein
MADRDQTPNLRPAEVPVSLGDNRLAVLAAEVRVAHAGVVAAATVAAERAIEAGKALTEAKALLAHGQWLPWLKEHCQISARVLPRLYMKIVRLGLPAPAVADLGLQAAGDRERRRVGGLAQRRSEFGIVGRAVLHQLIKAFCQWHPLPSFRSAPAAARGRRGLQRVAGCRS